MSREPRNLTTADEWREACEYHEGECEKLRAEIERLRLACDCHPESICGDNKRLRAENERLKAWHRHIARDPDTNFEAVAYARDALRGAPKP